VLFIHLFVSIVPWTFVPFSIAANTVSAIAGVAFVRWRSPQAGSVMSVRNGFNLLEGALVMVAVSAVLGTAGLVAAGMVPPTEIGGSALKWALANLFGVISVGPSLLVLAQRDAWARDTRIAVRGVHRRERAAWLVALLGASALLVTLGGASSSYALGLSSLPLMVLLWSATRFEPAYTYVAMTLLTLLTTSVIGLGIGGYQTPSSLGDVAILIGFMCLVATIPQMVLAMTHENRIAASRLLRRATTDGLTGLPNRVAFQDSVVALLGSARAPASRWRSRTSTSTTSRWSTTPKGTRSATT
jgi:integral membrane sensor domain MASE1